MGRKKIYQLDRQLDEQPAPRSAEPPATDGQPSPHPLSRLQRALGNQAIQQAIGAPGADMVEHHSPPTSGPGSRAEPLVHGRSAVQRFTTMRADAYYRSPVNPDNPVLVWTDGRALFLGSAAGTGLSPSAPDPIVSIPAGYLPADLHWDVRDIQLLGGAGEGGSLVVVARRPGQPDLVLTVTNRLEQRWHGDVQGTQQGAGGVVTRAGAEFLAVNDTAVPLELSGAAARGPIHGVAFPDGFFRYRAPGGDHDLYVSQGEQPAAYLVRQADGAIVQSFAGGTIDAVVPEEQGVVHLERRSAFLNMMIPYTRTIDLRASPPTITTTVGHASAEPGYAAAKARLVARGVSFEEQGLRLRLAELEALEMALAADSGRGQRALEEFHALEGLAADEPLLEVTKRIGSGNAYGLAEAGAGVPILDLSEPFGESAESRAATIRHEMTHVVMGALHAVSQAGRSRAERADLAGAMAFAARQAQAQARAGQLRATEYGRGERAPAAGTLAEWRGAVGHDPELAAIWIELLKRYRFIPDPEGTGELRGVSLADESRYTGASEYIGHPSQSVSEFAASFVACATVFRAQFVAAVLAAEAAGNAQGGGGGSYLRRLYRQAWRTIDARYVPLGPSPF
jgi:hypothetical protein